MNEPTSEKTAHGGTLPAATPATGLNPFDPASLRLTQDFSAGLGVKKMLLTVPVRKPAKEWWFRTNPDPTYRLDTGVIELKDDDDRAIYLVKPELRPHLAAETTFSCRSLFVAINTLDVVFIWPVKLPRPDGKIDNWTRSARQAAEMAQTKWCRIQANMPLQSYDLQTSEMARAPVWPDLPMQELLRIAFEEQFIDSLSHPILKRLRGEV